MRLNEEKSMMTSQLEVFKNDLLNSQEEVLAMRRELSSNKLTLETELAEKNDRVSK